MSICNWLRELGIKVKAQRVYNTIDAGFTYDLELAGTEYPLDYYKKEMRGVCVHEARLIVDALRAEGIESKVLCGYVIKIPVAGNEKIYHAWPTFNCGSKWIDMCPGYKILSVTKEIQDVENHVYIKLQGGHS